MKKQLLILTLFLASFGTYAQITLEQTYSNAGFFLNHNGRIGIIPFYLVHLEVDGDKYVRINKPSQTIDFYNLDNTFWKSINYSSVSVSIFPEGAEEAKVSCNVFYISQHLFDEDNEIEFLYSNIGYSGSYIAITEIVNEDGSIVFSTGSSPISNSGVTNQVSSIYTTTAGTKMILSNPNGSAEVYSLPGNYTPEIAQNNIIGEGQMRLFPNPSMGGGIITINYQLPPESTKADLTVCNSQGKQIKSYQISSENTNFQINSNDFLKGTYFYTISTPEGKTIASQKLIIIE